MQTEKKNKTKSKIRVKKVLKTRNLKKIILRMASLQQIRASRLRMGVMATKTKGPAIRVTIRIPKRTIIMAVICLKI